MIEQQLPDKSKPPLAAVWSGAQTAVSTTLIRIECAFGRGMAGLTMIGSLGKICDDGKDRARTALERLGVFLPPRRVVISVSPGEVKVDHTHTDLAFAVTFYAIQSEVMLSIPVDRWMFAAEVGIDGDLRPVRNIVPLTVVAMQQGLAGMIVAAENLEELHCLQTVMNSRPGDFKILGFHNLAQVLEWIKTGIYREEHQQIVVSKIEDNPLSSLDFEDMDLTEDLYLLAAVMASGPHSAHLRGFPGCGKSMFARRLPSIFPEMTRTEHLKALEIHSTSSAKVELGILEGRPPFRSPHHFASVSAMVGSATRPGELALACGGLLFLDELPEFRRDVLEGLREPLEDGVVHVSRAAGAKSWSANVTFVGASNPCPCGWSGSKVRLCQCPTNKLLAYQQRLSGPLLDRIDIHFHFGEPKGVKSALLNGRIHRFGQTQRLRDVVLRARHQAVNRNSKFGCQLNRDLSPQRVLESLEIDPAEAEELIESVIPLHASARSFIRCLKVARTLADVCGRVVVASEDLKKAWSWQNQI